MKKYLVLGLAAVLMTALLTPEAALAGGKGKGGSGASATVDQADPHFGDQVTFTVQSDLSDPWIHAKCYQSGLLVYEEWHPTYDGTHTLVFTLGPTPSWSGGSANCVADVVRIGSRFRVVGSTPFDVAP